MLACSLVFVTKLSIVNVHFYYLAMFIIMLISSLSSFTGMLDMKFSRLNIW